MSDLNFLEIADSSDLRLSLDTSLSTFALYLKVGEKKVEKPQCGDTFICSCSLKK